MVRGFFVVVTLQTFKCYINMGRLILVFSLIFCCSACEKNIDIKLDETAPKLVVDGSIETGLPPKVVLSKSFDYFGKLSAELLLSSFARNATVSITEAGRSYALKEDSVRVGNNVYLYFYTTDSISGKSGAQYQLRIQYEGQLYTANTTIPQVTRRIDSLWWEKAPITNDTTLARLMIKATDRPGFGDYIRYFTKANQEPFYPGFNSVFDDQVIDGKTYTIQVDRGVNKNAEIKDEDIYFTKGDTVTLKLCNIDKATFDFWRTFEFNYQSIGNPFSSPTKVISNISNGALGYFGGYGAQYKTLIIPK